MNIKIGINYRLGLNPNAQRLHATTTLIQVALLHQFTFFRQDINAAFSPGRQMSTAHPDLEEEGSKSELQDLTESSYRGVDISSPKDGQNSIQRRL